MTVYSLVAVIVLWGRRVLQRRNFLKALSKQRAAGSFRWRSELAAHKHSLGALASACSFPSVHPSSHAPAARRRISQCTADHPDPSAAAKLPRQFLGAGNVDVTKPALYSFTISVCRILVAVFAVLLSGCNARPNARIRSLTDPTVQTVTITIISQFQHPASEVALH